MPSTMTKGSVLRFSFPLMLASASQIVMITIDAAFVGSLGVQEIAAIGFSSIFIWTLYNLFSGIPICAGVFVSQYFGARDYKKCISAFYNGMLLIAVATTIVFGIRMIIPNLIALTGVSAGVRNIATDFLQIKLFNAGFFLTGILFASYYRSVGDTKTTFAVTLASNLLNVFLDYILIFGVNQYDGMGVRGAALASVISNIFGVALYAYCFVMRRSKSLSGLSIKPRINRDDLISLIQKSVYTGLTMSLEMLGMFLFSTFAGRLGDAELAASNIMLQVALFASISAVGLGRGAMALVGQFLGGGNSYMAYICGRHALEMNVIYTFMCSILLYLLSGKLCAIFNADPTVVLLFKQISIFGTIYLVMDGLVIISGYCLTGAGDVKIQFIANILGTTIILLPLTYWFAFTMRMSIYGAWLGLAIFITSYGLFLCARFITRAWAGVVLPEPASSLCRTT